MAEVAGSRWESPGESPGGPVPQFLVFFEKIKVLTHMFSIHTSSFSTTRWLQPSFDTVTKEIEVLMKRDEVKSKKNNLSEEIKFEKELNIQKWIGSNERKHE